MVQFTKPKFKTRSDGLPSIWSRLEFWRDGLGRVNSNLRGVEEVYPHPSLVFRAFELPFDDVKIVILGQDPYHTRGVANGLAFSTQPTARPLPPSLRNILKEYSEDLGFRAPSSGDLMPWHKNGVLLLNTQLTVSPGSPNSHKGIGWESLVFEALQALSEKRSGLVFILWGRHANEYRGAIDETKHLVISSGHPSPLARDAPVPFAGSRPFSRACEFLGLEHDFWRLP